MRKIFLSLLSLCAFVSICKAEEVRIGVLNGPSCVPAAYMLQNTKKVKNSNLKFEKFADAQALFPKLIKKEIDVGFLPVNVAAKVYNSSNGSLVCCAITGNGNISLITKDKKIKALSDLKGKKVYVAGQGATPEYMFKYLLSQMNIDVNTKDGVTLDFSIPTAQLVANLLAGKIEYAVVPEPFSTIAGIKSEDVFNAIDFQDLYAKINGENAVYPLTVMVCTKQFALEHADLMNAVLKQYEKSLKWTLKNPELAGIVCEKLELGLAANVVKAAIPKSNYVFIKSINAKPKVDELLNLFMQNNPESIGGKLPDEGFYF